jgi:integrase
MAKLTKRLIDAELAKPPEDREEFLWCSELRGFGARISPRGRVSFVIQYRTRQRRTRRYAFAVYGPATVEQARVKANKLLSAAHDGHDPSTARHEERSALTVAQVCERYLESLRDGQVLTRFGRAKRASTAAIDEGRISRHIVPLLGAKVASKITTGDVQRMVDAIATRKTAGVFKTKLRGKAVVTGGAGTAARVAGLLGGIWTWARKRGYVSGQNPVCGVEKQQSGTKDRVLLTGELKRLGDAMLELKERLPMACAALRLVALTGMRHGEVAKLRWSEIDTVDPAKACLRLEASKTGRSTRPLGNAAQELLNAVRAASNGGEYVFGGRELKKQFAVIFNAAGLHDARSHDLRRTFASTAAELGYGDATVAELLGHARRGVTERHYVRRPDAVLVEAASRTAGLIAAALDGRKAEISDVSTVKRRNITEGQRLTP